MTDIHPGLAETACDIHTGIIKHKQTGKRAIVISHGDGAFLLFPDKTREFIGRLNELLLQIMDLEIAEDLKRVQ